MTNENMNDEELIAKIAERAVALLNPHASKAGIAATIWFTHHHVLPLRLADLLAAKNHDFAHDVGGICNHLDRGELGLGGFRPRFAVRGALETL